MEVPRGTPYPPRQVGPCGPGAIRKRARHGGETDVVRGEEGRLQRDLLGAAGCGRSSEGVRDRRRDDEQGPVRCEEGSGRVEAGTGVGEGPGEEGPRQEGPAKTATAKKAPAEKAPAKKAPAKAPAKKAPAKKAPAEKAPAKKAPAKAPAKKAPAKAPANKAPAKKPPAKKAPATEVPAKKQTPTDTTASARRSTTTEKTTSATKKSAATTPAATKKTTAPAAKAATKATATKAAAKKPAKRVTAASLPVREGEAPWTAAEVREVRSELERDIQQLREELEHARNDLVDLMRDSGDGAGDDEADAGAKTYEREQEISLANNAREMLEQSEHALDRLESGSYGTCESCGNPIGKMRLQAAPRATLCMPCKTKQERR